MTHFPAAELYAFFASVAFGITQRETPQKMVRYGIYCFVLFTGAAIALSWGMFWIGR